MTLFNKTTTIQTIRLLRDAGFLTDEAFDANGEIHPAVLAQFNFQGEKINLDKCCARVASGGQCTKKRVNGEFCKSHARLLSECKATKNWPHLSQTSKCVGCSREAGDRGVDVRDGGELDDARNDAVEGGAVLVALAAAK